MDEIFLNFPEAEEGASAADFVPGFVIEGTDPSIPQCAPESGQCPLTVRAWLICIRSTSWAFSVSAAR